MAELNTAPPTDDIRSALAAAIAEHDKPTPAKEPSKGKDEPAGDKSERQRGQDGKFAKEPKEPTEPKPAKAQTEVEPELELEPEKPETKAEEVTEPEADEKPAEPKPLDPPANWKAADKETFKKLAPEAQQIMLGIQKGMDADYTKKTQAIAALKSEYEPVDKIFEPYRDVMKQKGFTPRTLIEAWANVEKKLSSGEQSALEVITGLINTYRVPVAKVASAFGIRPQAPAAQPAKEGEVPADGEAPSAQLPPEVIQLLQGLQHQVNGLTASQQAAQQNAQAARQAAVMNDIEKFKSASDEKGTLLHPHFEEVETDMASLALVAKTAGQPVPPLHELYEKAVWANPSTREKLITAKEQQVEEKRKAEARAKAAAAKKAAGSVTGAPGPGQASNVRSAERSLREELESAAEDMAAA